MVCQVQQQFLNTFESIKECTPENIGFSGGIVVAKNSNFFVRIVLLAQLKILPDAR